MKLFKTLLLLGVCAAAPAVAQDPVEIEIKYDQGTLANLSGRVSSFMATWTSNATNPGLVLNCGANNMLNSGNDPIIYAGTAGRCTVTLTTDDGWRISRYQFKASTYSGDAVSQTLTYNGQTLTTSATAAEVDVELESGEAPSIVITGANKPVLFTDFVVTLVPDLAQDDPRLEVDAEPAQNTAFPYIQTDLVGDRFNRFTAWYNLVETDAKRPIPSFEDADLYCFIASDGWKVYNKAAGTAAACADVAVDGEGNITVNGEAKKAVLVEKFCSISVEGGQITRDGAIVNNNAWHNQWKSSTEPYLTFSTSSNNMTTTATSGSSFSNSGLFQLETGSGGNCTWTFGAETMYIADYTMLAKKTNNYSESTTLDAGGSTYALTKNFLRISASGFGENSKASFTQHGTNGKGTVIDDIYVTARALTNPPIYCDRDGKIIYPVNGTERRIPAITTVGNGPHKGRLITIYDFRHHGGDIGGGNISLQTSMSDDNGETWTEPAYLVDADGNPVTTYPAELDKNTGSVSWSDQQADENTYWNSAFGDAAIAADRESQKVLLMAVGGSKNFFASRRNNPNQVVRWISEDGGDTWSEAQQYTEKIYSLYDGEAGFGYIDGMFIGSGRMMQSRYIKVGDYYRVYAAMSSQNGGGNTRNFVIYTDDFGETWNVLGGNQVCPVPSSGDEPKVEELPDGSVLLAARRNGGNRHFNIFRYTDPTSGRGHWDAPVATDMGFGGLNACNGEIMILPVKDNDNHGLHTYVALQSFPYGGSRKDVSIAYKVLDDPEDIATPSAFTTWDGRYQVTNRASVYSTMTWQDNNTLGFFFEEYRPGQCDGVYLNLTLEEITGGRLSYMPDPENEVANALRDALVSYRQAQLTGDDTEYHGYVGEPKDPQAANAAFEAYLAAPSAGAYLEINKAQYEPEAIEIVDNGVYRMISAHGGHYAQYTEPRYLAGDGEQLFSTTDLDDTSLFTAQASEEGNWYLYNEVNDSYIASTRSDNNQPLLMDYDVPGEFRIVSNTDGKSYLASVTPGNATYPAIHMASNGSIVIWTTGAVASQWYIEVVEEPVKDAIEEVETEAAAAPVRYYDLQGRPVARPTRGIYVTSDRRKLRF